MVSVEESVAQERAVASTDYEYPEIGLRRTELVSVYRKKSTDTKRLSKLRRHMGRKEILTKFHLDGNNGAASAV